MDTAVLISCMALTGTLLIVLLLLCRLVQPHDIAWFLSNREDKLKLSKMRLYNANGYLMHSGSEILLGSTGSFQRFDSVDRDYKPQYGPRSGMGIPLWRNSTDDPDIPPQPLRPAPSPKEAKLTREKHIQRQTSEPKPPSCRSIIISPIPRPTPRKQHSAPISFPLPLLISPKDPRNGSTGRSQETTLPAISPHPSTNPFLCSSSLKEEGGDCMLAGTETIGFLRGVSLLSPPSLTVPPLSVVPTPPSPEFGALKSANNPFVDFPTATNKCHQQHQQQQQKSCVFDFDPTMVQSLFNRPVASGAMAPATALSTQPTICSGNAVNKLPVPPSEEDSLRDAHKRLSSMENFRKMSRLIESNQLLLNIYQQFNRTIAEQPEVLAAQSSSKSDQPMRSPPPVSKEETTEMQPSVLVVADPSRTTVHTSGGPGKYCDSPRSDITENIPVPPVSRSIKHIMRNRSFSETEFSERKLIKTLAMLSEADGAHQNSPTSASPVRALLVKNASYKDLTRYQQGLVGIVGLSGLGYPYDNTDTLHKTVSESFLEQYSLARYSDVSEGARGDALQRGRESRLGSGVVLPSLSSESVASESSVVFTDLLPSPSHPVVGYLYVSLQFDQATEDGKQLLVTVQEAKYLMTNFDQPMDTFVKVFLTPDESCVRQTKVAKYSVYSSYQETFSFWIGNQGSARRTLCFHVYNNNSQALIGLTEVQIDETITRRPVTTWLKLIDSSYQTASIGELMLSLSYLPTAERLTVVVVKARNLALKSRTRGSTCEEPTTTSVDREAVHETDGGGNVFVKVYLLQNDRKISKKKTSVKRAEQFLIFNEAIIFSLPPYMLNAVQIRLSVVQVVQRAEPGCPGTQEEVLVPGRVEQPLARKSSVKLISLGHVIVGSGMTGKGMRHWHQMLTALRKPVAMWHGMRSTSKRKSKKEITGSVTDACSNKIPCVED